MSPDNLLQDDGEDVDIFEEENTRVNNNSLSKSNYGGSYKQSAPVDQRREIERYDDRSRNSARPKTGHRNTDSSYYLDDPNY